ncbi:uncharacterized protein FOMMEDRAFT_160024 [Fomitiporia mediterranea MF3/22]|uniref:uncharacterized protein n=1 Tax=Fomitiporia mediterranea (strain MF3/22) TaxID=694068 RepID=UPI0004408D36|nr:uncharacterized protein FOMMEDRAFT_160024 [Fomitiporia mediterranea MF3/22]EJC99602.1 hypothetical protein FOMMEDRAFT_160024 [Fomitiporia mediterranea MF3/22]
MTLLVILVCWLDKRLTLDNGKSVKQGLVSSVARYSVWILYWWFQSLTICGIWLIGHECVHGSFSPYPALNDFVGFILHSSLGTPYYSWKYSHHHHHTYNGHLDKDEHFIPGVFEAHDSDNNTSFWDCIEDTPIYQTVKLMLYQLFGFQLYLLFNASGQPRYPRWTSHFNRELTHFPNSGYSSHKQSSANSIIFGRSQRMHVVLSDIGIFVALSSLIYTIYATQMTLGLAIRLCGVPWLLLNHWIVMIVTLHHTDVLLPRYRKGAFTFSRGALVTVDRNFLGWQGKFFLHEVSHFHVVHHFFPSIPFYNLEEATQYAKKELGSDYHSCDTPVFRALWENSLRCRFIDAEGDIVFFKDRLGNTRYRSAVE